MKILLFHPWCWQRGGAERVCLEILKRSKHNIELFTLAWDKQKTFPEFQKYEKKIHEIKGYLKTGGSTKKSFLAALKLVLKKLPLESLGYDAMIISAVGFAELIAIRNYGLPVGIYCYTPRKIVHDKELKKEYFARIGLKKYIYPISNKIYLFLEKIVWRKFSLVMCLSKTVKKRIDEAKITTKKIHIVYPGADLPRFTSKKKEKFFFVPGRICYYKRQKLAIQAFEEFRREREFKDWKMIIAGNTVGEHQDYINEVHQSANKENSNIEIQENVPEKQMVALYQRAAATIFTALNEEFGLVPVESMACGTPVIAVAEGGVTETVLDNGTGYLVEANPKAIAEAMKKIARQQNNPFYRECIKRAQQFGWGKFVGEFDKLIDSWLENKK